MPGGDDRLAGLNRLGRACRAGAIWRRVPALEAGSRHAGLRCATWRMLDPSSSPSATARKPLIPERLWHVTTRPVLPLFLPEALDLAEVPSGDCVLWQAIFLSSSVLLRLGIDPWALALSVAAAVAIFRFKVGMIPRLIGCCVAGMLLHILGVLS